MDVDLVCESSPSLASLEASIAKLSATATTPVEKQVLISLIANRYFLFDVDAVLHVRRIHHICGTFVGGIPHVPHQNVFLGLPLELMPEEARILVEGGHAYVVDDVTAHRKALWGNVGSDGGDSNGITRQNGMSKEERKAVLHALELQGKEAARAAQKKSGEKREKALMEAQEKKERKNKIKHEKEIKVTSEMMAGECEHGKGSSSSSNSSSKDIPKTPSNLFQPDPESFHAQVSHSTTTITTADRFYITPTTSSHILPSFSSQPKSQDRSQAQSQDLHLPPVPPSYPLFTHLHSNNYFLAPGLRFGCQYMAYPGDPLRYHSHFLANGLQWDEEFDLLDLVGGGRLGTGVKKSFVVGGLEAEKSSGGGSDDGEKRARVRAFSIEWAGM